MQSGKTGLIFDCDGVLLDSIGAWHGLDAQLAEEAGIELTVEDRNTLNASTLHEAAEFFHVRYGVGESADDVNQRFTDILMDYYRNRATEVPGALAFVRAAYEAKVPMCVLSSSPQAFLQAGLGRAGFLDYIDCVLSVEELPFKKRDERLYPYVCDKLGVALCNTWMFDDSKYAVRTAHEAGLRTVGVFSDEHCGTHEQLGAFAEQVIDSFEGLDIADFLAQS